MSTSSRDLTHLFEEYLDSMSYDIGQMSAKELPLRIPKPSARMLTSMLADAAAIFQKEPMLLDLSGEFVVIGDLHGHLLDLYRILKTFDLPPKTQFLFLGDIVDRGEFSIETVTLVLILKLLFPSNVFIIRGNHEFESTAKNGGFFAEIEKTYPGSPIFGQFMETFSNLPMAAILQNKILCIHAGLSPGFTSIEQIRSIQRPISSYSDSVIAGLVWSDPREKCDLFSLSPRGSGFLFGEAALNKFLADNGIDTIIRGHECVREGWQSQFNNKIVTVFSASNYCGATENSAAVLIVKDPKALKMKTFPSLGYVRRKEAIFLRCDETDDNVRKSFSFNCVQRHCVLESISLRGTEMPKAIHPVNVLPKDRLVRARLVNMSDGARAPSLVEIFKCVANRN